MRQRRSFSGAFKAQVVLEVLTGAKSTAQLCREHGLRESLLCRWRKESLERAPRLFEEGRGHDSCQTQIAELERMVGRLTMGLEVARKHRYSPAQHGMETGAGEDADRTRAVRSGPCVRGGGTLPQFLLPRAA